MRAHSPLPNRGSGAQAGQTSSWKSGAVGTRSICPGCQSRAVTAVGSHYPEAVRDWLHPTSGPAVSARSWGMAAHSGIVAVETPVGIQWGGCWEETSMSIGAVWERPSPMPVTLRSRSQLFDNWPYGSYNTPAFNW
jgi:hypothetical protein